MSEGIFLSTEDVGIIMMQCGVLNDLIELAKKMPYTRLEEHLTSVKKNLENIIAKPENAREGN